MDSKLNRKTIRAVELKSEEQANSLLHRFELLDKNKAEKREQYRNKLTRVERKLLVTHATLKLQIELVPRTSWCQSLCQLMKKSQWNKIRLPVYEKANYKCEICKGKGTRHPA